MDLAELDQELQPHGQPEPEPAAKPEPKDERTPRERELERQLKDERRARKDAESAVRHWYDRAAGAAEPKGAGEPEPEPEPEIDVIDLLTTKGAKGLDEALDKLGYAKKGDIDQKIGQTRQQITQETKLYNQYPDLQDEQSEFYQTTLEVFKDLAADPVMAKSPSLVEKAAKQAARILGLDEPPRRKARDDDEDTEESRERDRVARVGRQAGDRGHSPRRQGGDDDADPRVERATRSLVERLRSEGADITVEGVMKRRERGVTVTNRSLPRPAARRGR